MQHKGFQLPDNIQVDKEMEDDSLKIFDWTSILVPNQNWSDTKVPALDSSSGCSSPDTSLATPTFTTLFGSCSPSLCTPSPELQVEAQESSVAESPLLRMNTRKIIESPHRASASTPLRPSAGPKRPQLKGPRPKWVKKIQAIMKQRNQRGKKGKGRRHFKQLECNSQSNSVESNSVESTPVENTSPAAKSTFSTWFHNLFSNLSALIFLLNSFYIYIFKESISCVPFVFSWNKVELKVVIMFIGACSVAHCFFSALPASSAWGKWEKPQKYTQQLLSFDDITYWSIWIQTEDKEDQRTTVHKAKR